MHRLAVDRKSFGERELSPQPDGGAALAAQFDAGEARGGQSIARAVLVITELE
jgi:hypothetical protein